MMITSRVTPTFHIKLIIISFFCIVTGHIPFTLLANNITDKPSFTLEVITDSVSFVRGVSIFKNRTSFSCPYRIDYTTSKNRAIIHIHRNNLSFQISSWITHFPLTVKMSKTTLCKHNGVIGFISDGSIQRILLGRRGSYRILSQRVIGQSRPML